MKKKTSIPVVRVALLIGAGAAVGCSDDGGTPDMICESLDRSRECAGTGDTGGYAEGADDGEAPVESPTPCALVSDGRVRTMYQCDGKLAASIDFETDFGGCRSLLGDSCGEKHRFGFDRDPYEAPMVMACCDPEQAETDEVLLHCGSDAIEQFCRSLPQRLNTMIDDGTIPVYKGQARSLVAWLNDNQQACYDQFLDEILIEPKEPIVWNIPNRDAWKAMKNIRVQLDELEIESAWFPEEMALECVDNDTNNTEVFEDQPPITEGIDTIQFLVSAIDVAIDGPRALSGPLRGSVALTSTQGDCPSARCSSIAWADTGGAEVGAREVVFKELALYAAGSSRISDGGGELSVELGALRLYGPAVGQRLVGNDGEIIVVEPGAARFWISGHTSLGAGVRWVSNATAIVGREGAGGELVLEAFSIEHVDSQGQTWKVTIPPTTWR